MKPTPDTIRIIYEMLTSFEPISKWKLPASKTIDFQVNNDPNCFGEFETDNVIKISSAKHEHLDTTIRTMAHEMIHLKLYLDGVKDWDKHGVSFRKLSRQVATNLGFDPKEL